MATRTIERDDLRALLTGNYIHDQGKVVLSGGKMLQVSWPRLTDKTIRVNGSKVVVEKAGTTITRRLVLRNKWGEATPSNSFVPARGNMFNAATKQEAEISKKKHNLFLFMSLEGKTHPQGEKDHPVNVPLDRVISIRDTREDVTYLCS